MSNIIDVILDDIRVELSDEFDRNFERKAFFNKKWQPVKKAPKIGSLMLRTSFLRNSIQSSRQGFRLVWKSSAPYASIHNEGGTIKRTSKKGKNYVVNMPQRQFVGDDPEVNKIIKDIVGENVPTAINEYLDDLFNQIDNG
ncbi:MAG TPA: phage virion morphogenesis protein [Dysgonomonas sp.]|uniref:phage virion morphogenesis protein n=1 Tax=unclassified Dysgonomonas TaxID=2630389 RepID=UPI0025C35FFD|nr:MULTISPECIES: phage virion morphogenesis protein [unclassified Dysgonomonas]HML64658.1 phage virion morphogenesis protein [Dysgonomonas sp.]